MIGNPLNNVLSNLRWGTIIDNAQDAIKHGTFVTGSRNGKAKLIESEVLEIRELLKAGELNTVEIAKKYNVVCGAISNIKLGYTWKRVR